MSKPTDTPSNLLFSLIAFQTGIIGQDTLVAAFEDWSREKSRSMAQILFDRRALDADDCDLIGVLVERHLGRNGGDPEKSLASFWDEKSTQAGLDSLNTAGADASVEIADTFATRIIETLAPDSLAYEVVIEGPASSRYRVLRPHAKGGLGVVYVAKDCELHREVALKEIQERHADDPRSRARFLLEAEITGGLEHPGIVPVYGLGCYSDGRPFYAMRFIRGDSLKDAINAFHADENFKADPGARSLEVRKLLRRFIDACDAIDYAHGRGVLHRDLKPANVMVGKYGETLVVDWGLAKATGRPNLDLTKEERALVPSTMSGSAETLPGSAVGTPGYMSPEQAAGEPDRLGPPSDVYSLGSTLYTILTGKMAFEGDIPTVLRRVRAGEFDPPRQLDPTIAPPLESICLMAMSLRPEDRYQTPRAMSEDLERWMADEPVSAHRDSRSERVRRWMRRRRTAVIAIAAAMLVAMVGLGVVLTVEARANQELKKSNGLLTASVRRERSRLDLALKAMETYYTGASKDVLLQQPDLKDLRSKLLQTPLDFYQKLRDELETGGTVDSETLVQLAEVINNLAEINFDVGKLEDALNARLQVSEIARRLLRDDARSLTFRRLLARSLRRSGAIYALSGRLDEARTALAEALREYEKIEIDAPDALVDIEDKAACLQDLGDVDCDTEKFEQSERDYLGSIALFERIVREDPDNLEQRSMLAGTQNNLGILYGRWGKPEETERWFRKGLATNGRVDREHPGNPIYRRKLASSYNNLGSHFNNTNRLGNAIPFYLEALKIQEALVRDHPTLAQYQSDVAISYSNLAVDHSAVGEREKARAEYQRAGAILTRLVQEHPSEFKYQHILTDVYRGLCACLDADRQYEAAESAGDSSVAIAGRLLESSRASEARLELARSILTLAHLHEETGRHFEAEAGYRQAIAHLEPESGDDTFSEARSRRWDAITAYGALLLKTGRIDQAEAAIRPALDAYEQLVRDNPIVSNYPKALAYTLVAIGDLSLRRGWSDTAHDWPGKALESYSRATDIVAKVLKAEPRDEAARQILARARSGQAVAEAALGRYPESLKSWSLALADGPERIKIGLTLGRAGALVRVGRPAEGLGSIESLVTANKVPFENVAALARVYALAARSARSEALARTAMRRLESSLADRGRDDGRVLAEELRDPDFDPIRSLPEFPLFLLDLTFPRDPFSP
jgi:serine/threonine protein kinase